ncbi:protein CutA homolog [Caerostris extrusa]|uniref:Protein CutA homolog n=1 Tax=Caerostris extrusa TaxID=172846 RepID=A0AAV4PLQ7_CAEEX|nr:protein CutA homolog [Caerostris extrusa]
MRKYTINQSDLENCLRRIKGLECISDVKYISNIQKTEGLVKEKLAGCVNIIPGIHSVYEWEGEIQKDSEVLMVIKSRTSQLDDLTKYVRENHPYQVCEVISTPIVQGNEPYLKWLNDIIPEKK